MDESAATAAVEDGSEICPFEGETPAEDGNCSVAVDTDQRVGVFCCQDCGEAFREEATYLQHRLQHPQQNANLGSHCDSVLDCEKDKEAPVFCSLCKHSFPKTSELHLHMKNHEVTSSECSDVHVAPIATKQHIYECPDCGKSYTVIGHFLNHQRIHRKPSKSVFHELEHLKKKPFQCETCGRNYSRASALEAHRRCHEENLVKSRNKVEKKLSNSKTEDNGKQNFVCVCGKAFSTKSRLRTHQRFSRNSQCSTDETKQKSKKNSDEIYCSECKKGFSSHVALFNHQRWHAYRSDDSTKRFPCEQCGKVFMTPTFYYRHQRTAHSDETPSKSFLHQVCQLQKKAFECKVCGLKFSRESALNSHQLQHNDVFQDLEKKTRKHSNQATHGQKTENALKVSDMSQTATEAKVQSPNAFSSSLAKESTINYMEEDLQSYEPGDFNVQIISASESEEEPVQDPNPDLELLCESDQDVRDDTHLEIFPRSLVSEPEANLKIFQVDTEQTDDHRALMESKFDTKMTAEGFNCPECYRCFSDLSSLHVHRMWHGVRNGSRQNQGQSEAFYQCYTTCVEGTDSEAESNYTHATVSVLNKAEGEGEKAFNCNECGETFPLLSALVSHQLHHPKSKHFQCPNCMMSYLHAASLANHLKTCSLEKKEDVALSKKEYNPKKTLLGPKIFHCEQCGKGFWSLGAFSHHKQNQNECIDLRLRQGVSGSVNVSNRRSRSALKVACPVCGRKFRHKGIMALHKRKHENGNHTCEICNRSFRLFSSLLRHQVVHNDQLLPPPIKSFQHQVEQLRKNTYSCLDCGKRFSRAKALQFHMKSHGYDTNQSEPSPRFAETVKDLRCATCCTNFISKASLRAHQKLCIGSSSLIAVKTESFVKKEKVDNRTNVKEQASRHEKKQTNKNARGSINSTSTDEKYKCDKCHRSFSVVGALNFHKRIHVERNKSGEKASLVQSPMPRDFFKERQSKGLTHCSECGRHFMSKSALGSHKRWHKVLKPSPKEEALNSVGQESQDSSFNCKRCGKQFFDHRILHRHLLFNPQCQNRDEPDWSKNVENGKQKECLCSECLETFPNVALLSSHFNTVHRKVLEPSDPNPEQAGQKLKVYQCSYCSVTFEKLKALHDHKRQVHLERRTYKKRAKVKTLELPDLNSASIKPESSVLEKKIPDLGKCKEALSDLPSKRVSSSTKQDSRLKMEMPKIKTDVSYLVTRSPKHMVKLLFKCDKCGKAFQTKDQLGTHKNKARSRPYCCALCCHSFLTENQLQQHLAWHDEVRCRLPSEVRLWLNASVTKKPWKNILPITDSK